MFIDMVVLDDTGNSHVSVAVNLDTFDFISNFIKYECHTIISKRRRHLIIFLLQSFFDVKKIVARQRTNPAAV